MEWTRDEFADAVTRHSRRMYRAARSVLDSGADAEDAVSQAILQAWQSLDKLRDREAVGPWLVRIAVNCAYALRRRQGRVVPKKNVEDHIFGVSGEVTSNAVEVYVSRLRKLLTEHRAKVIIHTIRGVGYLMAEEK